MAIAAAGGVKALVDLIFRWPAGTGVLVRANLKNFTLHVVLIQFVLDVLYLLLLLLSVVRSSGAEKRREQI